LISQDLLQEKAQIRDAVGDDPLDQPVALLWREHLNGRDPSVSLSEILGRVPGVVGGRND